MLSLLETMNFVYIYAKSHWKYHTFDRYYSCCSTKLRHKTQQKVFKCSLTFPQRMAYLLSMGVSRLNKYSRLTKGGIHPLGTLDILGITFEPSGPSSKVLPLNVSKWTPNSYLKRQNFISYATSVICKKP